MPVGDLDISVCEFVLIVLGGLVWLGLALLRIKKFQVGEVVDGEVRLSAPSQARGSIECGVQDSYTRRRWSAL